MKLTFTFTIYLLLFTTIPLRLLTFDIGQYFEYMHIFYLLVRCPLGCFLHPLDAKSLWVAVTP